MQSAIFGVMIANGRVIFMIGFFFLKRKFKKSCDEGQVPTLQVDGRCCLFNATMVLLSFKGEIYGLPRYQTHWNFI